MKKQLLLLLLLNLLENKARRLLVNVVDEASKAEEDFTGIDLDGNLYSKCIKNLLQINVGSDYAAKDEKVKDDDDDCLKDLTQINFQAKDGKLRRQLTILPDRKIDITFNN